MPVGLSGNTHRDTMNIRHNEIRKDALEDIRKLSNRILMIDTHLGLELDGIFRKLDGEISG